GEPRIIVPKKQPIRMLVPAVIAVAVVSTILFVIGFVPKLAEQAELKKMHEETTGAIPVVHTVIAATAPKEENLLLPANIGAIQYTTIFARVDGYLKSRFVDIGDEVKRGDLL